MARPVVCKAFSMLLPSCGFTNAINNVALSMAPLNMLMFIESLMCDFNHIKTVVCKFDADSHVFNYDDFSSWSVFGTFMVLSVQGIPAIAIAVSFVKISNNLSREPSNVTVCLMP